MMTFDRRVGVIQRVLPHYRAPFFNALGRACPAGLGVFAGKPRPDEMIKEVDALQDAGLTKGTNIHLLRGRGYVCYQLGLRPWLKALDPEVLVVEANPRYISSRAALAWMRRRQRPVIGWGLGSPEPTGLGAGLRKSLRKHFVLSFDQLIVYSQSGADDYAALGYPADRITIAPNAVTAAPAYPLPGRTSFRSSRRPRILFVGRLQARKQLVNLFDACASLPESIQPDVVVVGDGPDRERLEALAASRFPRVLFTGALYGAELADQFIAADLFVLPGTGGLAIQQAMSYGLPVIAAEADGTQADLIRSTNGWMIPPNDIPALVAALTDALSSPERLLVMGAESYRIVAEEINLERMTDAFIHTLQRSVT